MRGGHVTVYVTAPALEAASIGGSGDMRIDRIQAARFAASIAGSGDLEIGALQAREADFSIAGSGGIRAAGRAEQAEISIAGSGNVALDAGRAPETPVSARATVSSPHRDVSPRHGLGDVPDGSARCTLPNGLGA